MNYQQFFVVAIFQTLVRMLVWQFMDYMDLRPTRRTKSIVGGWRRGGRRGGGGRVGRGGRLGGERRREGGDGMMCNCAYEVIIAKGQKYSEVLTFKKHFNTTIYIYRI